MLTEHPVVKLRVLISAVFFIMEIIISSRICSIKLNDDIHVLLCYDDKQ